MLHLRLDGTTVEELRKKLADKGLPNLWLPRERDFYQVDELPILGSGKLDLKKCKEMACELASKGE